MVVRCEQLGIACVEWRTDRALGNVSMVFVTPESALTKRFLDYVEALWVTVRLDRVVIDKQEVSPSPKGSPKMKHQIASPSCSSILRRPYDVVTTGDG